MLESESKVMLSQLSVSRMYTSISITLGQASAMNPQLGSFPSPELTPQLCHCAYFSAVPQKVMN